MKLQRIIITISLITLFGCNPSENYLKSHKVFPYPEKIVQEKNTKLVSKKLMIYMSNIYMIIKKVRI